MKKQVKENKFHEFNPSFCIWLADGTGFAKRFNKDQTKCDKQKVMSLG